MQTNKQKWYRGVLRSLLYHKTSTKKKKKKKKKRILERKNGAL